jgi:hypothetical protein
MQFERIMLALLKRILPVADAAATHHVAVLPAQKTRQNN